VTPLEFIRPSIHPRVYPYSQYRVQGEDISGLTRVATTDRICMENCRFLRKHTDARVSPFIPSPCTHSSRPVDQNRVCLPPSYYCHAYPRIPYYLSLSPAPISCIYRATFNQESPHSFPIIRHRLTRPLLAPGSRKNLELLSKLLSIITRFDPSWLCSELYTTTLHFFLAKKIGCELNAEVQLFDDEHQTPPKLPDTKTTRTAA
jgi:hypothetical protein